MSTEILKRGTGIVHRPKTTTELMAEKSRQLTMKSQAANLVLLLDCSGSMSAIFAETTRYNAMINALPHLPQGRRVYFNSGVSTHQLPPSASTDLTSAIQFLHSYQEQKCLLISDGEPDDQESAMAAAVSSGKVFDVLFIGGDAGGKLFMESLAARTGGQVVVVNPKASDTGGTMLIADAARLLLAPPK